MARAVKEISNGVFAGTSDILDRAVVTGVRFYRADNHTEIELHTEKILPYEIYSSFCAKFSELTGSSTVLYVTADSRLLSAAELKRYLNALADESADLAMLVTNNYRFDDMNDTIRFLFTDEFEMERASMCCADVEKGLSRFGAKLSVVCEMNRPQSMEIKSVNVAFQPAEQQVQEQKPQHKSYYKAKIEDYTKIDLSEVYDGMAEIQFDGEIFAEEETEMRKSGRLIQTFSVYDGHNAILVKRFESRTLTREMLHEVKKGDRVRIYGKIEMDNFAKDLVCTAQRIDKLPVPKIVDTADVKRVEWHMHTNMSEMDAVCDIKEIINYAFNIGHPGIVITDHADVQSFVKAYNTAKGLNKKDPDRNFKVGLGCEMNMADDALCIIRNTCDARIDDVELISFDLETTGLSCKYDSIIEFGAVRIKNQQVVDRLQLFIKPPITIPPFITKKTGISNAMVANAKTFAEAIDEILAYIGDNVLVAHNATFDYHFLNAELARIGRPPLTNTIIDTLDMSRAVLKERRAYRLGNLSRHYHVVYDEENAHRADYDAEALGGVMVCLLNDAKEKFGCETINDLQVKLQGDDAYRKVRRSHVTVVAKNKDGIRDLYKLVTESNVSTLSVTGKASGKEGTDVAAEPRILRSSLQKMREHLLLGSSCLNGEVWELACNGDDQRLMNAMSFYDYIELQPLGNYSTFVALGSVPSVNRVKEVQKRIIDMAERLDIPVIADSDAHYLKKEQKIFRDVYIMSQGVGGAFHPLYIRDDEKRRRTSNPDQHLRLTEEMKKEFEWLDDPELVERLVIKNPLKLFEQLDSIPPVPSGTYPPKIENSGGMLRDICHATAKRMYEYNGEIPAVVMDRLDYELNNIITNGFDVHYYIAHLLVKQSNDDGYVVGSRGSVGSSFTATMSGITEVNPLKPHYRCPHCNYTEWFDDPSIKSGFDLPDKKCPHCGAVMKGDGQNIPFQTFLGFNADKVPDIDLNFSNEYQWRAHAFIKKVFGAEHAFRAGTIGTVADKTAFGYVSGYCEKMGITDMRKPMKDYLAAGCTNVKRTTGQHPGGIIIIPEEFVAEDFTPVQFPANDPSSAWMTTHYDFHDIHDNVLKFDILGHVDPTCMRLMQNIAVHKPLDLPMNDPETLSLFSTDAALKADPRIYKKETGALGLPEFGTKTTRRVLEETRPKKFSELVIISGLSHGTDVWAGNAQTLIQQGHPLEEVIGCRDDIMTYLLDKKLEPIDAFKTMEDVRKGRGLRPDQEENMKAHDVPDWYIDSCKKIKYMFPKAHAVAYVMMAIRIAWYKVHEPVNFYIQYFTLRCDAYEIETMCKGIEGVQIRMQDIAARMQDRYSANPVSNKEKALYDTLEVCEELYARGFRIDNVDLYKSLATEFTVNPDDPRAIIPPFTVIDGLGANVARSIEEARKKAPFLSKEDLVRRTQVSATMMKKLDMMGCLAGLSESNQMSLF